MCIYVIVRGNKALQARNVYVLLSMIIMFIISNALKLYMNVGGKGITMVEQK